MLRTRMILIKRCRRADVDEVNRILTHPGVYPKISDDGSPGVDDFDAGPLLESDAFYFLGWVVSGEWAGIWLLKPWNTITYEVHTCILPEHRGKDAIRAAGAAGEWMFHNTACRKVVTLIPEWNRPALAFALSVGMKKEGLLTRSFWKDGEVSDQQLLGIEKEE